MEKIDYALIMGRRTTDEKLQALEEEIQRVGYISLTEAISHRGAGGDFVMKWLESDHGLNVNSGNHRRWKIQVVCDEWGRKPPEITEVVKVVEKPKVDRVGRPITARLLNDMRRRGTFEKQFVERRVFPIDDKGCIECCYEDAGWFLEEYGIHYESGHGLCGRRELSGGPCKCPPKSGLTGERHVHYWRYQEAPPDVYSDLPKITKKSNKS